jgi:hypothetical protein
MFHCVRSVRKPAKIVKLLGFEDGVKEVFVKQCIFIDENGCFNKRAHEHIHDHMSILIFGYYQARSRAGQIIAPSKTYAEFINEWQDDEFMNDAEKHQIRHFLTRQEAIMDMSAILTLEDFLVFSSKTTGMQSHTAKLSGIVCRILNLASFPQKKWEEFVADGHTDILLMFYDFTVVEVSVFLAALKSIKFYNIHVISPVDVKTELVARGCTLPLHVLDVRNTEEVRCLMQKLLN